MNNRRYAIPIHQHTICSLGIIATIWNKIFHDFTAGMSNCLSHTLKQKDREDHSEHMRELQAWRVPHISGVRCEVQNKETPHFATTSFRPSFLLTVTEHQRLKRLSGFMQLGVKISLQEFAEEKRVSSKITTATVTQKRRCPQFSRSLIDFW